MKINVKLPQRVQINISDKSYDIKADFEFAGFENDILTLNTDIKAPALIKNVFLNNVRNFIEKKGFKCIVSFNKIIVDLKPCKKIESITYDKGEYVIKINNA